MSYGGWKKQIPYLRHVSSIKYLNAMPYTCDNIQSYICMWLASLNNVVLR